jgi:hypothetical protein
MMHLFPDSRSRQEPLRVAAASVTGILAAPDQRCRAKTIRKDVKVPGKGKAPGSGEKFTAIQQGSERVWAENAFEVKLLLL